MIPESSKLGCPNIDLCPLELSSTLSATERPEPVLRRGYAHECSTSVFHAGRWDRWVTLRDRGEANIFSCHGTLQDQGC